jgi:hypothetical protein
MMMINTEYEEKRQRKRKNNLVDVVVIRPSPLYRISR